MNDILGLGELGAVTLLVLAISCLMAIMFGVFYLLHAQSPV